nr:MAG TPA: hypothetical protein [Caudoviricetes sp.]
MTYYVIWYKIEYYCYFTLSYSNKNQKYPQTA